MTKLSIIVPVYNVEKYIRPCFESILKQGLDENDYEIIIVNDGTKDRSMEMIADIVCKHHNITVINQENQGLSVARNNGIATAKGEYILMPDSDDLLVDGSLQKLLDIALSSKSDLIVADFLKMYDGEIATISPVNKNTFQFTEKTGESLILEDLNPHECYVWRTLFRRQFLMEENIRFIPGLFYQDVPFTHECYMKAKKCIRTSWILNIYRKGREGSATNSYSIKKAKDFCIVISKTWSLSNNPNISHKIRVKIRDNVFVSFSVLSCSLTHEIYSFSDRIKIISFLRSIVPDLKFEHGKKQQITSLIYNFSPCLFIALRKLYGTIVEDTIQPLFHRIC